MFSDFSFTFLNPNSFEYLDIQCPTEVMAVGTIIFLVRIQKHFFFQYYREFLESASPYQTDLMSSTKIVSES